ncbi:MAG: PIN domain-containing protein [Nanoarchaeota archaeon]
MKFVVDTNVLISFFRDNPVRFIIINSQLFNIELYSPEHCWKELLNIKLSVSKYSKLSLEKIELVFEELKNFINIIPDELAISFKSQAEKLIHDKDVPIFALALKLNCPIWSNEPAFKEQSKIKVFNNRDIIELLL